MNKAFVKIENLKIYCEELFNKISQLVTKNPIGFFFICIMVQYRDLIFFEKKIGWDTLDAYYPYFLYIVDSFKSGSLPYYIPYILGGVSFVDNFFTTPLLNPIDLFLAAISTIGHPFFIFEMQFPIFALLSGYWIYKFALRHNKDKLLSIIAGLVFIICMLNSIIGQASFFYAFVLLAFLLEPFIFLIQSNKISYQFFACVSLLSLMLKSYFFFIPFVLIISFVSCCYSDDFKITRSQIKFVISLVICSAFYLWLMKPVNSGYASLVADLNGSFKSPDERLRSLIPEQVFWEESVMNVIADLIDNNLLRGMAWSTGTIILLLLFLYQFFQMIFKKDMYKGKLAILLYIVISVLFCSGFYDYVHNAVPYINSMRWSFTAYAQLALVLYLGFIFLFPLEVDSMTKKKREIIVAIWLFVFSYAVLLPLVRDRSINFKYLTNLFYLFIAYAFIHKTKIFKILLLCSLVVFSFRSLNPVSVVDDMNEQGKIRNRKAEVVLNNNIRDDSGDGKYDQNDREWLYNKTATMNGYNNSVHPIFRYLKGEQVTNEIVIPLCPSAPIDIKNRKEYPENDNDYLKLLKTEIIKLVDNNRCVGPITRFKFTPDQLSFQSASNFTLVLQNITQFISGNLDESQQKILPGGMRLLHHAVGQDLHFYFDKSRAYKFILINVLSVIITVMFLLSYIRSKNDGTKSL